MSKYVYEVEKNGGFWHWKLKSASDSPSCWSGAAFTKRGAMRAMKRIKKREDTRRRTRVGGVI